MGELSIGNEEPTDFGTRFKGSVETEDRKINISWHQPRNPDLNNVVYVLANGWLANQSSMNVPASEALRAGNMAITFNYSNTGTVEALEENTQDLVAILDALSPHLKKRAIGLSMGGRVLTRALTQVISPVESATAVASAGFISGDLYGWDDVVINFAATAPEIKNIILNDPRGALRLGATTMHHCVRRGRAVIAELAELVQGDEHENVRTIMAAPNAPYMRFMYGSSDRLFPRKAQEESVRELPFNHVAMYKGGHTRLVHDPSLSESIYRHDEEVLFVPSLRAAA